VAINGSSSGANPAVVNNKFRPKVPELEFLHQLKGCLSGIISDMTL
jgi:hypothetical protein